MDSGTVLIMDANNHIFWIYVSQLSAEVFSRVVAKCSSIATGSRKTSNISRTLVGSKIVDNSDVVGASPVGAAPTTSSFST